jgi:hypothetical protein
MFHKFFEERGRSYPPFPNGLVEAISRQLDNIADKRKTDKILAWSIVETWDASALKEAENLLRYLDPKHPLLTELLSVKGLSRPNLACESTSIAMKSRVP